MYYAEHYCSHYNKTKNYNVLFWDESPYAILIIGYNKVSVAN
jgi:hypothetical protein